MHRQMATKDALRKHLKRLNVDNCGWTTKRKYDLDKRSSIKQSKVKMDTPRGANVALFRLGQTSRTVPIKRAKSCAVVDFLQNCCKPRLRRDGVCVCARIGVQMVKHKASSETDECVLVLACRDWKTKETC